MRPSEPRDSRVDAIKGVLILLVVFGHLLELFIHGSKTIEALYAGIYAFHMPLFVLMAGLFAKVRLEQKDYEALIVRVLLPLILFQAAYLAPDLLLEGKWKVPALQPVWILWFLLSLLTWRVLAPLLDRLRFALGISVAVAVVAGFNEQIGQTLSVSRTLYFLPFFLFGMRYGRRWMEQVVRQRWIASVLGIAAILVVVWWMTKGLPHDVLYGSKGYQSVAAPVWGSPALGRLLLLLLALVASGAVVALTPASSKLLGELGRRSLTIFLVHGLLVLALGSVKHLVTVGPWATIGLCLLGTAVLTAVTAAVDPALNRGLGRLGALLLRKRVAGP